MLGFLKSALKVVAAPVGFLAKPLVRVASAVGVPGAGAVSTAFQMANKLFGGGPSVAPQFPNLVNRPVQTFDSRSTGAVFADFVVPTGTSAPAVAGSSPLILGAVVGLGLVVAFLAFRGG